MKAIRSIINWISVALLVVGILMITVTYFTNKSLISYITKMMADASLNKAITHILIGAAMILGALVLMIISLRLGKGIRAKEKKKRKEEEETRRRMKEETEAARAEADRMKVEAAAAKAELEAVSRQIPMNTSESTTEETQES